MMINPMISPSTRQAATGKGGVRTAISSNGRVPIGGTESLRAADSTFFASSSSPSLCVWPGARAAVGPLRGQLLGVIVKLGARAGSHAISVTALRDWVAVPTPR
eukprot:COSAG01_NODE_2771_length_7101_cov_12.982148_8_plen_104_part_00